MTEQTIPAGKVRELAAKYDSDGSGDPERLLADLLRDLHGLTAPPQPTTGLFGRWAKHPERGDVVCVWDKPTEGRITVRYRNENSPAGVTYDRVSLADLTFPEQTTRPEDVPAGEAWLVDASTPSVTAHNAVGMRYEDGGWHFLYVEDDLDCDVCLDNEVTLIAPLTPERPGKDDLQARYDALKEKYAELDRKCFDLGVELSIEQQANGSHNDWSDEQPVPAWRIEHDSQNLHIGEYIIDNDDDIGTVTQIDNLNHRDTDGRAYGYPESAPFIVFPNKDAATPEAVAEAKKARDKETGE